MNTVFSYFQVLNAQAAGFSMVVVYDSEEENMVQMGSSTDRPVDIPLVRARRDENIHYIDYKITRFQEYKITRLQEYKITSRFQENVQVCAYLGGS